MRAAIAITGALVQWVRDNLGLIKSQRRDRDSSPQTVTDNGGVYFVPAFSGLYAPYWMDNARGIIAGLTRYANKRPHRPRRPRGHRLPDPRSWSRPWRPTPASSLDQLRTDGGMVANNLLMQFQADLLNRSVLRPAMRETTALGAAYAAGLASGYYADTDDLIQNWEVDHTWNPQMDPATRDRLYRQWKKAVGRAFDWIEDEPSK